MLLGQLVAICFAQNLFYLAILLSPLAGSELKSTSRSRSKLSQPDQHTWTPYRSFYGIPLFFTVISVALIPYVSNTPNFLPVLYIPHVCLMLPPLLQNVIFRCWGMNHLTPQEASRYYLVIFRVIIGLALVLQAKTTIVAVFDDTLTKHEHRHSILYPGKWHPAGNDEGRWVALWTAFGDHPAVSSVGWDTVICLLSLIAWVVSQKLKVRVLFGLDGDTGGIKSK
jgi:hypothetical protein